MTVSTLSYFVPLKEYITHQKGNMAETVLTVSHLFPYNIFFNFFLGLFVHLSWSWGGAWAVRITSKSIEQVVFVTNWESLLDGISFLITSVGIREWYLAGRAMLVSSSQVTEANDCFQSKSSEHHSNSILQNSSLCSPCCFYSFSNSIYLCFPVRYKYETQNLYPSQLWLHLFCLGSFSSLVSLH